MEYPEVQLIYSRPAFLISDSVLSALITSEDTFAWARSESVSINDKQVEL